MKKVLHINLGGIPFTINDDAYRRLDGYLLELEKYFSGSESRQEILSDIESRISELFTEILGPRKIIEDEDVVSVIRVMGTTSEFGEDPGTTGNGKRPWDIRTGKRFFRDPDDKVLGGVCSGLAAYFGVREVIWVRLAFVLLAMTAGFSIVAYIVIWALVPEAKNAADRLAMSGEQANVQNIARMVERGIEDLSSTIKDNWKDWRSKKKSRHKGTHIV